jgi:hypothetical protein
MAKANANKKHDVKVEDVVSSGQYQSRIPILGSAVPAQATAPPRGDTSEQPQSIFGVGISSAGSLFG